MNVLTDQEILEAVNAASLEDGPGSFVIAVGRAIEAKVLAKPVDILLYCPNCGYQHVDREEGALEHQGRIHQGIAAPHGTGRWMNPPHRSHLCAACGCTWRPADVPTNGVAQLKTQGKADTWSAVHNDEVRAAVPHGVQGTSGDQP